MTSKNTSSITDQCYITSAVLKSIKHNRNKLLFLVLQPFMNPAMDIFLQMSTDSPFLPPFLESCSNETWFRTVAMVLRAPRQDIKLLERLSIVLQKLSKIRYITWTILHPIFCTKGWGVGGEVFWNCTCFGFCLLHSPSSRWSLQWLYNGPRVVGWSLSERLRRKLLQQFLINYNNTWYAWWTLNIVDS